MVNQMELSVPFDSQDDRSNHHQVTDHFIKVCKGFACFLTEKLLTQLSLVLASPFSVRVKP